MPKTTDLHDHKTSFSLTEFYLLQRKKVPQTDNSNAFITKFYISLPNTLCDLIFRFNSLYRGSNSGIFQQHDLFHLRANPQFR